MNQHAATENLRCWCRYMAAVRAAAAEKEKDRAEDQHPAPQMHKKHKPKSERYGIFTALRHMIARIVMITDPVPGQLYLSAGCTSDACNTNTCPCCTAGT